MSKVILGNVKPVKGKDYFTEQDINELDTRYARANVRVSILPGSAVTFAFDGEEHTALVSCRAPEQDKYALFVYSGYGAGGVCSNIERLCGLSSDVSYEISQESADGTNGFVLWNHGSEEMICTVFSLMGNNPVVVSGEDDDATEVS